MRKVQCAELGGVFTTQVKTSELRKKVGAMKRATLTKGLYSLPSISTSSQFRESQNGRAKNLRLKKHNKTKTRLRNPWPAQTNSLLLTR